MGVDLEISTLRETIKQFQDRLPYKGTLKKRERFAKRIRAKQAKLVALLLTK